MAPTKARLTSSELTTRPGTRLAWRLEAFRLVVSLKIIPSEVQNVRRMSGVKVPWLPSLVHATSFECPRYAVNCNFPKLSIRNLDGVLVGGAEGPPWSLELAY